MTRGGLRLTPAMIEQLGFGVLAVRWRAGRYRIELSNTAYRMGLPPEVRAAVRPGAALDDYLPADVVDEVHKTLDHARAVGSARAWTNLHTAEQSSYYRWNAVATDDDPDLLTVIVTDVTATVEARADAEATAAEQVRSELAAALHDGVLQSLTHLSLLLSTRAPHQQEGLSDLIARATRECRELIDGLRPPATTTGVSAALRALIEQWRTSGLEPPVVVEGPDLPRFDPWRESLVYQAAAEALRNALHHSQADRIAVHQDAAGDEVVVEIVDDGVGIDASRRQQAAANGHLGLVLTHERMAAVGGECLLDPRPSGGTNVRLRAPLT